MGRKIFISFLGTGNYKQCKYVIEGRESKVVTYVQSAIMEILANENYEYVIFCTDGAGEKHYESLKKECGKPLNKIKIPEGSSEKEIWDIFNIVFHQLKEEDELTYDVTHSYRSLPMLGITLIQYAKFLKNITVEGIFYGAFETLGNPQEVEKNFPNTEDRKVPLINLTAFSALQDWTIAANNFINLGNANMIETLTRDSLTAILSESMGKNKTAIKLRQLSQNLQKFSEQHRTNRGTEILKSHSAIDAIKNIEAVDDYDLIPPFKPIVKHIESTLSAYQANDLQNLFRGVEWCIDKGLIQEGLTQLQEGVLTILAVKVNCKIEDRKIRELISSYLSVRFVKNKEEWKGELGESKNEEIISQLDSIKNIKEVAKCFDSITKKRNDINHGGFVNKTSAVDFLNSLQRNFIQVKEYLF